mmetsp:Transcript_32065/g.91515  ORF Transcript_32065/g.91515 Transcript_32065/m.91515 type:complete len:222 (+) Transcript_32065:178-843(+)
MAHAVSTSAPTSALLGISSNISASPLMLERCRRSPRRSSSIATTAQSQKAKRAGSASNVSHRRTQATSVSPQRVKSTAPSLRVGSALRPCELSRSASGGSYTRSSSCARRACSARVESSEMLSCTSDSSRERHQNASAWASATLPVPPPLIANSSRTAISQVPRTYRSHCCACVMARATTASTTSGLPENCSPRQTALASASISARSLPASPSGACARSSA